MNKVIFGDCRDSMRQLIADGVKVQTCDLAYCAGVIDSGGTIGVKRSTYSMRVVGDSKQPTYSERICVKQVTPEAVDLLHHIFGGTRYYGSPGARNGKRLYVWQVTDMKAAACLEVLLPFLRIKANHARNCLSLREIKNASKKARVARGRGHVGSASRTVEMSTAMECHYMIAKELNRVGV